MSPLVFLVVLSNDGDSSRQVYFPGDDVKGQLLIELENPIAITELGVEFVGTENIG